MLQFHEPMLEDKSAVDAVLRTAPCPTLEYNFTVQFIWKTIFHTRICVQDGFFYSVSGKDKPSFLFPAGNGDVSKSLAEIDAYVKENGIRLRFHSLSPAQKELLESLYPDRFDFEYVRDAGDYIYDAESLRTLKGKKLAAKRNHINRFLENHPDWSYERINAENMDEVKEMNQQWCEIMDCDGDESLREEICSVRSALKNYDALALNGGLLRTGGKVIAFSIGERLNDDTYLVHIEKAFADIQGAYPMMNQQFVLNNAEGYSFINREDDAGDEGLRKAKLSYRPVQIAEKYVAREK